MITVVLLHQDGSGPRVIFTFELKSVEKLHKAIHIRDLCRRLRPDDYFEVAIRRQDEG